LKLIGKNFDELTAESINDLVGNTVFSHISPASNVRAILDVINRQLETNYVILDTGIALSFLSTASGEYLDNIGEMFGLSRKQATKSSVSKASKIQKFYVESGTFGGINNSQDITIPIGTVISSEPNQGGVRYVTTEAVTLNASDSEGWVSIKSIDEGSASHVGKEILSFHNFTGYADSNNDSLLTSNIASINNGSDAETDNNYRYRISKYVTSSEGANETAIRLAMLSIPGVSDVKIVPYVRGLGSFDVFIKSTTPEVPDDLISTCQEILNQVAAYPVDAQAKKPITVGVSFELTIVYNVSTVTDSIKREVENNVKLALEDYVNNLDIGEQLVLNQALSKAIEADDRVLSIGKYGKAFDNLTLYRESKFSTNKLAVRLMNDYKPLFNEKLIIEPTLENPIIFN